MLEVCRQFARGNPAGATAAVLSSPLQPELRRVANAFVELQDARHDADYDLGTTFTRLDVLQKVRLAEEAFADWDVVRSQPNSSVFLGALLFQQHWR
jgi:hypothetical protein